MSILIIYFQTTIDKLSIRLEEEIEARKKLQLEVEELKAKDRCTSGKELSRLPAISLPDYRPEHLYQEGF